MKFILVFILLITGCSIPTTTDVDTNVYLFHGLAWNPITESQTGKIKSDLEEMNLKVSEFYHWQYPNIGNNRILIGKSMGADSVLKIAHELDKQGIAVDLLIVIDPFTCREVPKNVKKSVCIRSWCFSVRCDEEYIVNSDHFTIGGLPEVRSIIIKKLKELHHLKLSTHPKLATH